MNIIHEPKSNENRALPRLKLLSESQVKAIRSTALKALSEIGFKIHNETVFRIMADTPGVTAYPDRSVVKFSADLVQESVAGTPKQYTLYGRDGTSMAKYGQGEMVFKSSPGDPFWSELETKTLRMPNMKDTRNAIDIADALSNFDIVGAMAHPSEIPEPVRAIHLVAELVKRTRKPIRVWVSDGNSARYIVEILQTVAGGSEELRRTPMTEHSLEPISPFQIGTGLEALLEFAAAGLPIVVGPIVQAMLTGPATLAGTVAQCLAEGLGTLVIIQRVQPGLPVALAAANHHMDPKSMNIVYGSPEQGLLAAATTQVIKSYDLPCIANAGYTNANVPDTQAGLEKGMTALLAALAGADSFAPMGVSGTMGSNLLQLIIDDEMIGQLRRTMRSFAVTEETLAFDVMKRVGIGGSFITDEHTALYWRDEYWLPEISNRHIHNVWLSEGGKTILDRAIERRDTLLSEHEPDWLDEKMQGEIDSIVSSAEQELLK